MPKIELHRPGLHQPLLCTEDHNVIAVASDQLLALPRRLPLLDLNHPERIADFICTWLAAKRREHKASRRVARTLVRDNA
jgi:hypothetical protein